MDEQAQPRVSVAVSKDGLVFAHCDADVPEEEAVAAMDAFDANPADAPPAPPDVVVSFHDNGATVTADGRAIAEFDKDGRCVWGSICAVSAEVA